MLKNNKASNAIGPTINNSVVERMANGMTRAASQRITTLNLEYLTYGNMSVAAIVSNIFLRLIVFFVQVVALQVILPATKKRSPKSLDLENL